MFTVCALASAIAASRSPSRPSRYGGPVGEADWERRVAAAWEPFGRLDEADFLALIEDLAAELPAGSGPGLFERASSLDATDHPDMAVPLYRQALERGLAGERQAAGRDPARQLAAEHRARGGKRGPAGGRDRRRVRQPQRRGRRLPGAALTDAGREREAVSVSLAALARHLPRYQRSVANYARLLVDPGTG